MDNFRKGLHSQARACAKTFLSVCPNEFMDQNLLFTISAFLGLVAKSFVVFFEVVMQFWYQKLETE
jgi:hypothetical protein